MSLLAKTVALSTLERRVDFPEKFNIWELVVKFLQL